MRLLKVLARVALYSLPVFFYLLVYCYDPLINTIVYEMPKSTKCSWSMEVYNQDSFGASIKAGFAKRDITPKHWSWLAGYHPSHPGILINDNLWVKSLAIQDESGELVVVVSCDLIGLLPDEIQKIKSLVKNVNPDRVFISCTHTHSGPDTMGLWGLMVITGKKKGYMEFLRKEVAKAIDESVVNIQSASLRFGNGEFAGYSMGRYENPPDNEVSIMQVLLSSGQPITLVNYACHPDVIKSLRVTGDFVYFLDERLKVLIGGETMFVPGAIGGVQPIVDEHGDGEDFYFARTIGENLADEIVFKILKKPIILKEVDISLKRLKIKSTLENSNFKYAAKMGVLSDLRGKDGLITTEVSFIKIGSAEFLTVPGELFPKIWWQVKPLMKGKPNFILGLTNGAFGYIMTPEDFKSGRHKYHANVSVGPTFGAVIKKALSVLMIRW